MKHATSIALDALEGLLAKLREADGLTERKRGVFYRKSSAFVHFHEDPTGFFADVRTGLVWERLPVNSAKERKAFLTTIRRCLQGTAPA